eukprot:SAG11_NODE_3149_length_2647_cov_8.649784_2_plen_81_part_00
MARLCVLQGMDCCDGRPVVLDAWISLGRVSTTFVGAFMASHQLLLLSAQLVAGLIQRAGMCAVGAHGACGLQVWGSTHGW